MGQSKTTLHSHSGRPYHGLGRGLGSQQGKEKEGFPVYGKLNRALHNVGPGRVAPTWAQRGPQRGLGKIGAPRSRLGPFFTAA